MNEVILGLSDGSSAFINDKNNLFFQLLVMFEMEPKFKEMSDLLHISEKILSYIPYFILFDRNRVDKNIQDNLNKM